MLKISNAAFFAGERNVPMHKHHGVELVLVLKGECSIDVMDVNLKGGVDTLFILPADTPHNQNNIAYTVTAYVNFTCSGITFKSFPRTISVAEDRWISRWLLDIVELYKSSHIDVSIQTTCILSAILDRIKNIENYPGTENKIHPVLNRATKLIESDIARERTVASIARFCSVSPSYLNALFKRHFGYGPVKYLQNLRMRYARRLLTDPYMPVKQIGIMCGYDDVNYFCRLFRKNNGMSPGQFRERCGKKQK